MKYLIVAGNPVDGLTFTGPFTFEEQATSWAERECSGDWWVAPLETP